MDQKTKKQVIYVCAVCGIGALVVLCIPVIFKMFF